MNGPGYLRNNYLDSLPMQACDYPAAEDKYRLGQTIAGSDYPQYANPASLPASERAEMERIKAEYAKQARCEELMNLAQQIEHMRQRLMQIDATAEANMIDPVIQSLFTRWNDERNRYHAQR